MKHTSYIEISRSALAHNMSFMRRLFDESITISSVVKGNAYGHGIEVFVPLAQELGINHFSVFSVDESYRVLDATDGQATILILGMVHPDEMTWVIENKIEFYVFDVDRLNVSIEKAKMLNQKARIHIEVETGMNRTGFSTQDLKAALKIISKNEQFIEVVGFCTHYAGAESIANYHRIKKQKSRFIKSLKRLEKQNITPSVIHSACSAAAMRYASTRMDMVRIGILQYGFFPSREVMIDFMSKKKIQDYPLRRVISWKSQIMDIKHVKAGEFVGYGTSYLTNVDMTIATVPIGYSHGFTRALSNTGRVLIQGQRLPVVGTVNMNMMSVDISTLTEAKRGDEVVIIGRQGELELSVASFSEFSEQVNYELLTRLPSNIPRITVD